MTELDDRLRRYLDDKEAERSQGVTLVAVRDAVKTLADAQQAHEVKCDERWRLNAEQHKSARVRIEGLESRAATIEGQEEDTGRFLVDLEGKVKRVDAKASLPPTLKVMNWLGQRAAKAGEHWVTHMAMVVLTLAAVAAWKLVTGHK